MIIKNFPQLPDDCQNFKTAATSLIRETRLTFLRLSRVMMEGASVTFRLLGEISTVCEGEEAKGWTSLIIHSRDV